jgi:hypothetical protein
VYVVVRNELVLMSTDWDSLGRLVMMLMEENCWGTMTRLGACYWMIGDEMESG